MALEICFCQPILLLLPLFLFTLLFYLHKNKQHNKPNLPPGPPKLPIIGNLHQIGDTPHRSLWNLSKKYGPIMLMQFGCKPTLVVSSAEIAREVLKTHDMDFCSRPPLTGPKRLSYNFLDVAFVPYGEYWKKMRKICVIELFSVKRVQSFGFVREEEVASMIKSISESSSTSVNLTQKLFTLTDHIICRTAFGKSYEGRNFDNGRFEEVICEALGMLGSFAATDFFPYVGWIVDRISGLHGRLEKSFNDFDIFYQQAIDEHKNPERVKPEQEDIIDMLLAIQNDQLTGQITDDHIKAILMNIFLAGVDTSTITMVWVMAELARNPTAMKKVQEEIRNYIGKKGKVEERDVEQLEYLKMVVKETLRLHPPGVLLIPRECMHYCKINGYDIYPKTRVQINVWGIGRSPEYWDNPEEFFPERFKDDSVDFKGQDFQFLPFGAGRRGCPGMNMGITTVELSIANLLYSFDWEVPNGMKKEDIDMEEEGDITVRKKSSLHLVPIKYNWLIE